MNCLDRPNLPAIPGYALERLLGEGGMGRVYLARSDAGVAVAVKFLPRPDSGEAVRRVERELRLAAEFRHPNLVTVLASGHSPLGEPYLVMDYVPGGSLRQQLRPNHPLPLRQAAALLRDVAAALGHLHARGVVHRDVKPENILLDADGCARLGDFGLARRIDAGRLTQTGEVLGTLDYLAPEQLARLPVDGRADQYALAVLAYELLTGRLPRGRFKAPSRWNRRLTPRVDAVLFRALQEDPDDRFADIAAFAHALRQALAARGWPWRLLTGVAATAAVVATAAVWLDTPALSPGTNGPSAALTNPPAEAPQTPAPPAPVHDAAYFLRLAGDAAARHQRELAITCYTEAIRVAPHAPMPYVHRAHSYLLSGQVEPALADLDTALRLDPQLAAAHTGRGAVYLQLQDYNRAQAALDEAIRLDPDDALAFAHRGRLFRSRGELPAARRDLDRAVALDAECGLAYFYRGLVRQTDRQYREARDDLLRAVRCTPDNPFAHGALAVLLTSCPEADLRDPPAAVRHARQACELTNWKDATLVRRLAAATLAAGDAAAAADWCAKALALTPPAKEQRLLRELLARCRKPDGGDDQP